MKKPAFILSLTIGLCSMIFCSCKKDDAKRTDCFPNADIYRKIVDKPATVRQQAGGTFYIIEQGTIDTKLNPCNLPTDFQVNNLQVIISGDVKTTIQGGPGPCCTENFCNHQNNKVTTSKVFRTVSRCWTKNSSQQRLSAKLADGITVSHKPLISSSSSRRNSMKHL